ncbi:galactosylceramide sulfotransferase-like [Amphiura filiformis]|uniref:galactosylceramide sulfotransferase-like n=1 Tax=Amphiura filiformis TaxID=82378 RepID=UPI003B2124B2
MRQYHYHQSVGTTSSVGSSLLALLKMRCRRVFFLVVCVLAVVVLLSVLNGHKMISSHVSVLMSDANRNVANAHEGIRNFLSQQLPNQPQTQADPQTGGPNEKTASQEQIPNRNIPPADHIIWPNLNQSALSITSTTPIPQSHSTAKLKDGASNGPVAKPQSAQPLTPSKQQCSPRRNIVFFKMHKCSSSTVQNILFRYGEKNDLDFVIPPAGNYLGHSPFNKRFMLKLPTREYNILCYHTRFSATGMAEVMPKDSVYVSILREPVAMYESMFTYTKYEAIYHLNAPNPLKQFLESPRKYYDLHGGKDHAKNPMLFDFGLENHQKDDQFFIDNMIEKLDKRFDLVMMTEYFHESLILFKELMCWTMDDIVYFTLNARSKSSVLRDITPKMKEQIKQWNLGDLKLYNHFNKTFWQKVRDFGEERMKREITELVERNEQLYKYCIAKVSDNDGKVWHPPGVKVESLQLKPSAKNDPQCAAMARTELPYTALLVKKMKSKYHLR